METKSQILLIEPDQKTAEIIHILLRGEGYRIAEAKSGRDGLSLLSGDTDLVILASELPDRTGASVCEEIRAVTNAPVLFLSNKNEEDDLLLCLLSGGDDFLTKPFSHQTLLVRVKALLRRYLVYRGKSDVLPEAKSNDYLERSVIKIHTDYNDVSVNGEAIDLPDIEYRILRLLMQYPNKIFSAQNLYESVWKEPYFYSCNNTVMVHIRRLRTKIEADPKNPTHIKTVWGKGYRFE